MGFLLGSRPNARHGEVFLLLPKLEETLTSGERGITPGDFKIYPRRAAALCSLPTLPSSRPLDPATASASDSKPGSRPPTLVPPAHSHPYPLHRTSAAPTDPDPFPDHSPSPGPDPEPNSDPAAPPLQPRGWAPEEGGTLLLQGGRGSPLRLCRNLWFQVSGVLLQKSVGER